MQTLYIMIAHQRSGHHGALNWVCTQHGNITHMNNPKLINDGHGAQPNRPDSGYTTYGAGHDVFLNLESMELERLQHTWMKSEFIKCFDNIRYILHIRRFRNWLASTACHPGNKCMLKNPTPKMQAKWDRMIRIYHHHLEWAKDASMLPGKTVIQFDRWFAEKPYRELIAKKLGLDFTDAGLLTVPRFASGSTFDKRKYDGKAQDMGVLERWKQAEDNPLYQQKMAENSYLDALSEAFFEKTVH